MTKLNMAAIALAAMLASLTSAAALSNDASSGVAIVVPGNAEPPELLAAKEFAECLSALYPRVAFQVTRKRAPADATWVIRLGSLRSAPKLVKQVGGVNRVDAPESYLVTTTTIDGRRTGIILGGDSTGVMYGVYGLLEKLGYGFYLSYDTLPERTFETFTFDQWDLADAPLVSERLVFNWHNFLSSCPTWNLKDWKQWIRQSQKAGYNGVMVHAYGNNPMASFDFDGLSKPIGYLTSTKLGRDWGTNHVNDTRRLRGGFVFEGSVFGSEAAPIAASDQRVLAARNLMGKAFVYAEQRGMNVTFALDVDTASANPRNLILALPENARFPVTIMNKEQATGQIWLVNPETPAGYRYYKIQIQALLDAYPQIDCLAMWFRRGWTPWMGMRLAEMPESWQREYHAEIAKAPEAEALWRSANCFALNKLATAFQRALNEIGRTDVELGIGSWQFSFLPAADRFLPRHVKFLPLDYSVLRDNSQLDTADRRAAIAAVGAHRPVVPIVWAHHDDGNYVGRPYTPYPDFHDKLFDSKASGYGVIHWMTRPLDLYFESLSRQVWKASSNESLKETCSRMAEHSFGSAQADRFGDYLRRWVTEAPKFGRETSAFFIKEPLEQIEAVTQGSQQRLKLLESVDEAALSPAARKHLDTFKGLERYILDVYQTEDAFQRAKTQWNAGDLEAARRTVATCHPEEVIERYARFTSLDRITRGEQGLIVSMNTRWLTHYVRLRQQFGLEPVRYNFAPTSHDPLAQSPGRFTFHFDLNRRVWECLGKRETGAEPFALPDHAKVSLPAGTPAAYEEIGRTGIQSAQPLEIALGPIMAKEREESMGPAPLPTGNYRVTLLMLDPESTAPGQRVFEVRLVPATDGGAADCVDIFKQAGRRNRVLSIEYRTQLRKPGAIVLALTPIQGKALLSGALVERIP